MLKHLTSFYSFCSIYFTVSTSQFFRFYCLVCAGFLTIQTHFGNVISATDESWKYEVEYFKSFQMNCELGTNDTAVDERILLWVLPDGEVIRPNSENTVDHIFLKNDGLLLEIDRVDDELFGLYLCVVDVRDDIKVIKRGLNLDGPYYGPEHDASIKHNAMIGGICAGGTFVLMISLWIVHAHCCKSNKNREKTAMEDVESANVSRQSEKSEVGHTENENMENVVTAITSETDNLEKIYDQADGILAILKYRTESNSEIKTDKVPISLMDSGEYHTILELGFGNAESFTRGQSVSSATSQSESESMQAVVSVINGMKDDFENTTDKGLNGFETETDNGKHCDFLVSPPKSDKEAVERPEPDTLAKVNENEAEVVYATPNKPKKKGENDMVVNIEGDVVIEETGAKIVVTSSPPTPVVMSETENVVNKLTDNVLVTGDSVALQTERLDIQNSAEMIRLDGQKSYDDLARASRAIGANKESLNNNVEAYTKDSVDIRL